MKYLKLSKRWNRLFNPFKEIIKNTSGVFKIKTIQSEIEQFKVYGVHNKLNT